MTAYKIDKFGGMLPAWDTRLLPDGQADYSVNAYLFSGALTGWRQPKLLRQLTDTTAQFVYRVPNKESNNTAILADDSKWLEFLDPDTTVMRSPVVQDQWDRFYFASPSTTPRYNTYDRIATDQHSWILGVPASGCTPGVQVTGGGDTIQGGFPNIDPTAPTALAYIPGNRVVLVPYVPTGSMLVQSISFNPTGYGPLNFRGVVYSDLNGKPFERIGYSDVFTADIVAQTQTAGFTNPVSVISNTTYWFGIIADTQYHLEYARPELNSAAYSATFSNTPPDPLNVNSVLMIPTLRIWAGLLGSSVFEARGYVYTWVTAYGEEGPPSEPVVVNGWSNGTWTVTLWQPTIENLGADYTVVSDQPGEPDITMQAFRYITHTRVYRTISNQSGLGSYFLVAEIPVTQGVYIDNLPDDEVALNSQLVSLYWFGPPEDLQSIQAFPNGIAVGFRSNEVWFSEAYRPHAWPPGYVLTTEFPIVGLGVVGQAVVVCTRGTPYVVNGVNPASMALTKVNLQEPCLHRGSIVTTDTTALYVSQNGLIQVNQSGAGDNMTEGWISREKWQKLTPQHRVRAVKHASCYFAFGADTPDGEVRRGYTIELSSEDKTSFTIWPQAGGHRLGYNNLTSPNELAILNVELDAWTGTCVLVQGNAVYYYDFTDQNPVIVPYRWRSKTYQQMAKKNFEVMRAFFTVPDTTPDQVERNVSAPQPELGDNQYGIVRVFLDGELWTTRELRKTGELLRILSGIKGEQWQWEIEGRVEVSNLQVATSVKELATI